MGKHKFDNMVVRPTFCPATVAQAVAPERSEPVAPRFRLAGLFSGYNTRRQKIFMGEEAIPRSNCLVIRFHLLKGAKSYSPRRSRQPSLEQTTSPASMYWRLNARVR